MKLSGDTVYHHITHWKAGSQWLLAVLRAAFNSAVVEPEPGRGHVLKRLAEPGRVFPCCYITAQEYQSLDLPRKARRFVVIRDLRDTLVSGYFSIRHSHKANPFIEECRSVLERVSVEEGLIHLMGQWLAHSASIQQSWLAEGEPVVRLEDFMTNPAETLYRALSGPWGIRLRKGQARRLVRRHSYTRHSGGRAPGEEDVSAHYRKGVHGDWRNHFTPLAVEHFKKLYNPILVLGGYEKSRDWHLDRAPKAAYESIDESRAETVRD